MTILEWIKANVKDGAKITEAEELIKDLDPLKNIETKEQALAFIQRNDNFNRALEYETQKRVENHDKKLTDTKWPEMLKSEREKIMKELNPDEDPRDKRIRELEERDKDRDRKEAQSELKSKLRQKAKDLNYDPLRAERFYIYGDEAEKMLTEEADFYKTSINKAVETKIKDTYTTGDPKTSNTDPAKLMTRADNNKLSDQEKREFFKNGGRLTD